MVDSTGLDDWAKNKEIKTKNDCKRRWIQGTLRKHCIGMKDIYVQEKKNERKKG